MTIGWNLSLRLAAILLAGFVALQLLIAGWALSPGADGRLPYGLPPPPQAAAIVAAVERAPQAERPVLVDALDNSLYSIDLVAAPPPARGGSSAAETLAARYAAAMPGRAIEVDGRLRRLNRWMGGAARPARFFAPLRLSVRLADGRTLRFTSQPSATVRRYLRNRSLLGAIGGLFVLAALLLAIRRTTRPLARLSREVRGLSRSLDAPDLPASGPREVRDLAVAFNEMKTRIRALIAERSRVLAAVAHDMRTYLTRLRLRAEYIDDPGHRERAVRDLDEMTALLNDTLFFAERDAAPAPAQEPVDLGAELAAIVRVRAEMGEPVDLAAMPPDLHVRATPLALRRILANLIDNGLRYGTRVSIAVERGEDAAVLTVVDDGAGVPDAVLGRLGQPFQRLDESRSRDTGGAGLGLAIVRALADREGVSLRFANREQGGLAVRLEWPLA